GALTRLALARGPAASLAPGLGVAEDSQQGIELVRCHTGKAPEGAGVTGQGLVDKHLATSTLPEKVGRSCQKAIALQPYYDQLFRDGYSETQRLHQERWHGGRLPERS